jgi:hypothetical protein
MCAVGYAALQQPAGFTVTTLFVIIWLLERFSGV